MLNMVFKGQVLDKFEVNGSEHVCAGMMVRVTTFALGQQQSFNVEVWFPHHMKKRISWFMNTDVKYVMIIAKSMTKVASTSAKFEQPLIAVLADDIDR